VKVQDKHFSLRQGASSKNIYGPTLPASPYVSSCTPIDVIKLSFTFKEKNNKNLDYFPI